MMIFSTSRRAATRVVALLPLVAAIACSGQQQPSQAQQIKMSGTEFSFSSTTIELTVGMPVHLTISNNGQVDHDMKSSLPISSLSYQRGDNSAEEQKDNAAGGVFDVDFNKGHTAEITFTPTQVGVLEFHCDVPGHADAGMKGTFVVR